MDEIGVFTPEQARQLWQWYQTAKQHQPHIQQNFPIRRTIDEPSPHRVFVKNTSGEECPAFACMKITGVEIVGGITTVTIDKPDTTDGEFLFNCQFAIADGENGWAFRYGIVIALGDGVAPTAANVKYQPAVGTWTIEESEGGFFTVFGEHNVVTDAVIGRFSVDRKHCVILDAALAVATNSKTGATSCLATICDWSGTAYVESNPVRQITVYNHSESTAYAIDTFGFTKTIDGHWWFFGDCAAMAAR